MAVVTELRATAASSPSHRLNFYAVVSAAGLGTTDSSRLREDYARVELRFADSCVSAQYRPVLECFVDAAASSRCPDSMFSARPTWGAVMYEVPFLANGFLNFTGPLDFSAYLHGSHYRVSFEFVFGLFNGSLVRQTVRSPLFAAPPCFLGASVAINGTTSCASCPDFASCSGTIHMAVDAAAPAWRPAAWALPFAPCDERDTRGCFQGPARCATSRTDISSSHKRLTTLAFGSYASTLRCEAPAGWSDSAACSCSRRSSSKVGRGTRGRRRRWGCSLPLWRTPR